MCEAAIEAIMAATQADRASVLVNDEACLPRFKAWRGLSDRYRAAVEGHSPWPADTSDAAPVLVEDVLGDESIGALRDVVVAEGIRALGFIPLTYHGRLFGKFMVYYDAPHKFSGEETKVATAIATHVSFGLMRAQAEAAIDDLLVREQAARKEADAARANAERQSQAKDEFLAMLAHELRNPLHVIASAGAVMEKTTTADAQRAAQVIRRQTDHLARLLADLLDVARITSGHIELEHEVADLGQIVELALEAQRHAIERKRQHVILSLSDEHPRAAGDRVRLQQVVENLVENASKYTPPGGSIWVTLALDGGDAVLRVRDDGMGIPPDKLEVIFDLFAQLNPTLARSEGGLGIGLTLVQRIVELHGGTVRAHSEGAGGGAELVVHLPLAVPPAAPLSLPSAPAASVPRRVLVVEDHRDGREMLVVMLRLYGHQVLEAETGGEGVELAGRHLPDVVLVDIGLPDMSGYEVAERLREDLGQRVRLLALTGYGQPRDRLRSERAGFDAHLVKPVDPIRLAETLQKLV